MDVPYSQEELRKATHELIGRNGLKSCYIRPLVTRGVRRDGPEPARQPGRRRDRGVGVGRLPRRGGQGARRAREGLVVAPDRPAVADPAVEGGGQYLNSVLAKIESLKAGYEEAILLDERGMVCEGTGENIFVVTRRLDPHARAAARRTSTASTAARSSRSRATAATRWSSATSCARS